MKVLMTVFMMSFSFTAFSQALPTEIKPVITKEDKALLNKLFDTKSDEAQLEKDKELLKKFFNITDESTVEKKDLSLEGIETLDKLFGIKESSKRDHEILSQLFGNNQDRDNNKEEVIIKTKDEKIKTSASATKS